MIMMTSLATLYYKLMDISGWQVDVEVLDTDTRWDILSMHSLLLCNHRRSPLLLNTYCLSYIPSLTTPPSWQHHPSCKTPPWGTTVKLDLCHVREVGVFMNVWIRCKFVLLKVGSSEGFLLSSSHKIDCHEISLAENPRELDRLVNSAILHVRRMDDPGSWILWADRLEVLLKVPNLEVGYAFLIVFWQKYGRYFPVNIIWICNPLFNGKSIISQC